MNECKWKSLLFLWALLPVWMTPTGAAEDLWFFEGVVEQVDAALVPDLQSGWVLAGSFYLDAMAMQEVDVNAPAGAGRLLSGITAAELAIELYYQTQFYTEQNDGYAGVDYFSGRSGEADDRLHWFIPMAGELGETGFRAGWLHMGLAAEAGGLIRRLPVQFPPQGLAWQSGWFRLQLIHDELEPVWVQGRMEVFAPEAALPVEALTQPDWAARADELARRLRQQDEMVRELSTSLQAAQLRIDNLRELTTALITERQLLEDENVRLLQRWETVDADGRVLLDGLKAERALLEEELQQLERVNTELLEELLAEQTERAQLQRDLARLQAKQEAPAPELPQRQSHVPVEHPLLGTSATMTIVERHVPDAQPVIVPRTIETDRPSQNDAETRRPNMRRPPKFR